MNTLGKKQILTLRAAFVFGVCFVCNDVYASVSGSFNFESPCPDIFQFTEENGALVGNIKMLYPKQNLNKIEVQFSFISSFLDDSDGRLYLAERDEKVTRDIIQGNPVYYKLKFPRWHSQPKITKIYRNEELVCVGPPSGVFPGKTTRTVAHKSEFKISGTLVNIFLDEKPNKHKPARPSFVVVPSKRPIYEPPTSSEAPETTVSVPNRINIPIEDRTLKPLRPTQQKLPSDNLEEVCGKSVQINTLIFGGTNVKKGKYPWLTVMYVRKKHGWDFQCVGTLISKKHVLTSAHCTEIGQKRLQAEDIVLALGLHDLRYFSTELDSLNVLVREVILHPDYQYGNADADLALLELEEIVQFTILIRPICLWRDDFGTSTIILENQRGSVAGWGLDESLEISSVPKETVQPVVSNKACLNGSTAFQTMISERTFCAGLRDHTGPCNGDSGTGFMMFLNSRWYLRGVVSVSLKNKQTGDCDLSNYVVYTDVAKFKHWIRQITSHQYP